MPPYIRVEIVTGDPLIYTWLGTPFFGIITIPVSIYKRWGW